MQFRQKIEAAILPLVSELRRELAKLRTVDVLNHYQFRLNLSQLNKDKLPDGFWAKGRYVSALVLADALIEAPSADPHSTLERVDELVERIYDCYSFGAVYEPGRSLGSEREFLTRLGLGLGVREPDALGFPEQFRAWALARFQLFNERYFVPTFGVRFEDISSWIDALSNLLEKRLNGLVDGLRLIVEDVSPIREEVESGKISIRAARERADRLKIAERMDANAKEGDVAHLLSFEEIVRGIPEASAPALLAQFQIHPGGVARDFTFPHSANPLDRKFFVSLPNGQFYFLDPSSAERIAARVFEAAIRSDDRLRHRYLSNRDRATEKLVLEGANQVFPKAVIRPNYYLEKGSLEKDLIIVHGRTVILVESKNSRLRAFRGISDDLVKFESDFGNSVQSAYDQAVEVKRRILTGKVTTLYDEDGNVCLTLRREDIEHVYIVCVAISPRGPFGTDLSYELEKDKDEPFPLSLGLFDFQTICKHFNSDQFARYLQARELLHGHATTGDELNFAGYFLKYGHLKFEEGTFLDDDFSSFFDRKWYREHGIEVEEPPDKPVFTSMQRKGNRLFIERSSGKREVIRLPSWVVERTVGRSPIQMKGSDRNKLCPCGSGLKLKRCCGVG